MMYYIRPEANAHRFYRVAIDRDLFGESVLVRAWGRIGCSGASKVECHPSELDAVKRMEAIIRAKKRKGYNPVAT